MFTHLIPLFRPPVFKDAERARIAQQLHYILLSSIAVAFCYLLIPGLANEAGPAWKQIITASMALFMVLLFGVLRRGHLYLAGALLISSGLTAIVFAGVVSQGVRNPGMVIVPLILMMSSVLLGSRITIIFGVGMTIVVTLLFLFEKAGILIYPPEHGVDANHLVVLLIAFGLTIAELHFTVTQIVQGAQQIRRQAHELQDKNELLEQTQAMLEARTQELSALNAELQHEMNERARTESILRQKQKLESIGLLAGGVAHDFNNLLTSILTQSSLALRKLPADQKAYQHIEKSLYSTQRAADLTRQLLAYAGKSTFQIEPIDLNQLIQENRSLLETMTQKNAALQFTLAPQLPAIELDRGQMQQVLMNLVINAAEAIEHEQGVIRVMTSATLLDQQIDPLTFVGQAPEPGYYVNLTVEDNGSGMAPAVLERIFDPYFSTKARGHGLGLSAVLGIIQTLRGGLQVTSTPGEGAYFRVYLRASTQTAANHPIAIQSQQPRPTGEIVLVVDDEADVREAAIEILHSAGYRTLSAANGAEGIEIFRQHQAEIGVVLLDVLMPGLNGPETLENLRTLNPHIKVIMTSGYSEQAILFNAASQKPSAFLAKPYTIDELTRSVAALLSPPA
ncbi:MAG: response regulator [Caldilineaceae bacterium]